MTVNKIDHNVVYTPFQPYSGISCNMDEGFCEPLDSPICEDSSSFKLNTPTRKHVANTAAGVTMMITGTAGIGVIFAAKPAVLMCSGTNIFIGLGLVALSSGIFLGYGAYELGASLNGGEGLGIVIYKMIHGGL